MCIFEELSNKLINEKKQNAFLIISSLVRKFLYNSRENNFMKKTKNQNIYNRFSINIYGYAKSIKLLNNPRYKKSTNRIKLLKAKIIIIIYMRINLVQIYK